MAEGRNEQRQHFDDGVRIMLIEQDLDKIEQTLTEIARKMTSVTRSNYALVITIVGSLVAALIAVLGAR